MNNLNQLMKQAQQMQAKLAEAQNRVNSMEFSGTSGGGMVTAVLNGKGEMLRVSIDPKLMVADEAEIVGDLIVAAHNDAKAKIEAIMTEEMGGLIPSGMKMPF